MTELSIARLNDALSGRYTLESEIGQGGMATVYLAQDLKHNRKVALKVLKPELAAVVGGERFLAEIEVTANLQHPNILPLFDSGEADGFLYYVMPYVEGETLRDRIDREHQLPVDEAVRMATEVAEALDHAHRQGVVHRDIKPGNILLRDGRPLVADFGIALAVGAAGGTRLTETGLSVGTPYYMSPEQATGDSHVGPATDIYALACVLYEMLVGDPPYPGSTAQAVLGKIISGEHVSAIQQRTTIPTHVDAAIRRSLEKLPADRFTSAGDFARALRDPSFRYGQEVAAGAGGGGIAWKVAAAVLGVATVALAAALALQPEPPSPGVARYQLREVPERAFTNVFGNSVAISPDGRMIAYTGAGEDNAEEVGLWIRDRDNLEPRLIPRTESAFHPTFSPDGTRVAFVGQDRTVQIISLEGRPPLVLRSDTTVNRAGISWTDDGYLYYSRRQAPHGISRIPEGGGEPEVVTTVDTTRSEVRHYFPDVLPGSELMLVTIAREETYNADTRDIGVVRLGTGEVTVLFQAIQAHWSTSGHIIGVLADGSVVAVPFDEKTLETGPMLPLFTGVGIEGQVSADLAVSRSGTLVYAPGTGVGSQSEAGQPVWVTRSGGTSPVDPDWRGLIRSARFSRDGTRVAYDVGRPGGQPGVELKELDRGPRQLLSAEGITGLRPTWAADQERIVFISLTTNGERSFDVRRADAATRVEPFLAPETGLAQEIEFSPDGRWLVVRVGGDMYIQATEPGSEPESLFADSAYFEGNFAISPDSRWIAYTSAETGEYRVYVSPFPNVSDGRTIVSLNPGTSPRWSRDGRELYYKERGGNFLTAEILVTGDDVRVGERQVLFQVGNMFTDVNHAAYDVHPDGRLLMTLLGGANLEDGLIVVEGFAEEIEGR
jgi:serine/threonine-protein kinase